jgi:hypothetical protein
MAMQRTAARRATDAGEPSNAQIAERIDGLSVRFEEWIKEHRQDHKELCDWQHDFDTWRREHTAAGDVRQHEIDAMAPDVDDMRTWRDRVTGGLIVIGALCTGSFVVSVVALLVEHH